MLHILATCPTWCIDLHALHVIRVPLGNSAPIWFQLPKFHILATVINCSMWKPCLPYVHAPIYSNVPIIDMGPPLHNASLLHMCVVCFICPLWTIETILHIAEPLLIY